MYKVLEVARLANIGLCCYVIAAVSEGHEFNS